MLLIAVIKALLMMGRKNMDVFKLDIDKTKIYTITKENIDDSIGRKAPWFQSINGHDGWFAVCHMCNNPIQIIGMLTGNKLYGRHYIPKNDNLKYHLKGIVDRDELEYCRYYNKNKVIDETSRRPPDSELAKQIQLTFIYNFDRVIYLLEKTTGIQISTNCAKQMLVDYKDHSGWCYRGATLDNIPWTFAYTIAEKNLFGCRIMDEEIITAIQSKISNINFKNGFVNNDSKAYLDLKFYYIHHKANVNDEHLFESIQFTVSSNSIIIASKTVEFDHAYFRTLINSNNGYRKKWLVELARQIMLNHFISNFKTTKIYLLKKLKYPELCNHLLDSKYCQYISFTLEKSLKFTHDNTPYLEIIVTYKVGNNLQKHYTYFYSNGRSICFETLNIEKKNHYNSFSNASSWFCLPGCLQSYKLGSLLLFECISFRDEFYPLMKLSSLTLSDDTITHPENEVRRNKLYQNFGYVIEGNKAVHSGVIATIIDSEFSYTVTAIDNCDVKIEELLEDLQNYSNHFL